MSQDYYIRKLINLKDENIKFYKNWCEEGFRKNKKCKILNGYLSYVPHYCNKCGIVFESNKDYEKKGFKNSMIVIPTIYKMDSYLSLNKQRIKCLHCYKSFTCSTSLVDFGCFISNDTKLSITQDLIKKRSEKDIAIDNNVSPNTVERIIDSYFKTQKLYKHYLPKILSFDEFKSVKSANGAMSFNMCNGENGKIIDIIEDRKLNSLLKYFAYYTHKARSNVKLIVIDMYSPYISLINKMFPNAKIIIDKFHIIQLISRSLNKTRIMAMKKDKANYNKMKRYWKLILKDESELDCSKWMRFTCFKHMMTQKDVVNYILNQNEELKATYIIYQKLLSAIKNNNKEQLNDALNNVPNNVSSYMKTSIKSLTEFKDNIYNTFDNKYHNGFIEGNNNFIKVLKRIAFGFRSFRRFKARIMICKGLIKPTKKEA